MFTRWRVCYLLLIPNISLEIASQTYDTAEDNTIMTSIDDLFKVQFYTAARNYEQSANRILEA